MSLFAIQTIWKQTQYYGCCNQHGFPALMRLWETLPKTRGFTLSKEIVHLLGQIPLKQKTKLFLKHRWNPLPQMDLPSGRMLTLKNLNFSADIWAKSLESDCFWVRPPTAHIEVSAIEFNYLLTVFDIATLNEEQNVTAKEFRSNIHWYKRFYQL